MNTWLWSLGQNTITVALMLPFVLLACRLFRNRPAAQHVLWVVVLLKFVTPPIVSWPWTVEQMGEAVWTTPAPGSGEQAAAPLPAPERSGPSNVTGGPHPDPDPGSAKMSVDADPTASTIAKASEPGDTPISEPQTTGTYFPVQAIAGAWLLGAILCGVLQLRRIARHAAFVRRGTTAPAQLTTEVKAAAQRLGMNPPRAVLARGIMSPFVWCLGYLRLVWPESLGNATAIARSRGIIAHELAHVRRRDHWVAWLELVAGIVWWWNPLYWYVRRRLRETAEMACDALAIASNPGNCREYAEMLLELSAGFKNGSPAPVLAIGAGTPSSFERRLTMILSHRVSGKMSSFGILAAIGFALVALPHWLLGQQKAASEAALLQRLTEGNTPASTGAQPSVQESDAKKLSQEEKEAFTAWGKEVGGLQAGLGFRPGERRVYRIGETITFVVLVRNVGKKDVKFESLNEFFFENAPSITDGDGKPISLEQPIEFSGIPAALMQGNLAPGKGAVLCELDLKLRPASEKGKGRPWWWTLYETGKFQVQFEKVGGNIGKVGAGIGTGEIRFDPILSKLATGKLEIEVKEPEKMPPEKEAFTAWGKEVGGLQAGLGFRPGEKRAYHHGETVTLVVRVRNVGKEPIKFEYLRQFFIEKPPTVTDGKDELKQLGKITAYGIHIPVEVNLAAGKEIELYELKLYLGSGNEEGIPKYPYIFGTGKFQVQYEKVLGNSSSGTIKIDPALDKLATGKLELEVKEPEKLSQEKEAFTAWGKEVGGLQAGLGFRPGQKRAYHHGEEATVVLRVRNVGKEAVDFKYIGAFFVENSPTITDADGKRVQLPRVFAEGLQAPHSTNVAAGKEVELYEWNIHLLPEGATSKNLLTIRRTGKFSLHCERIVGPTSFNPNHPNPTLDKLATGKLELEVKTDPPPATERKQADLQGVWDGEIVEFEGRQIADEVDGAWRVKLLIDGDRLTLRGPNWGTTLRSGPYVDNEFTFKVNHGVSPKEIDLRRMSGQADEAPRLVLGVYDHKEDVLRVCLGLENAKRPTELKTDRSRSEALLVLKRAVNAKWAPLGTGGGPPLTGKLELEIKSDPAPTAPDKKDPPQQEKESFTAWGKEVGGLQAGLGFRPGEKRVYSHGETVKVVLRVRNVGKEAVDFKFQGALWVENPPTITDPDGAIVQLPRVAALGRHNMTSKTIAPGKEVELLEWKFVFRPKGESTVLEWTTIKLPGTGKFSLQCKRIVGPSTGNPEHPNPTLDKLATGKLELDIKSDPPPATEVPNAPPAPVRAETPKELEFLNQYPRFSNLSLDMTEQQFRAFLEQQKLVPQLSIPRDGQLNYSVPLGDGNRLTVMFGLDGKCRGIEPISGKREVSPHTDKEAAGKREEKTVPSIPDTDKPDKKSRQDPLPVEIEKPGGKLELDIKPDPVPPALKKSENDKPAPVGDLGKFQGVWSGYVTEVGGEQTAENGKVNHTMKVQVRVKGDECVLRGFALRDSNLVEFGTDGETRFRIRVDEAKSPKSIDLEMAKADDDVHALACLGVYALVGDELNICLSGVNKKRPSELKTQRKSSQMLLMLQRDPKAKWEPLPKPEVRPQPDDQPAAEEKEAITARPVAPTLEGPSEEKLWAELGVKVERVPASAVRKAKQELGGGLKVLAVRPGSPAMKAEISKDDIIVGLHIWETLSIDSCLFILDQCREDEIASLKCSFVRNGRVRSVSMQLPPGKRRSSNTSVTDDDVGSPSTDIEKTTKQVDEQTGGAIKTGDVSYTFPFDLPSRDEILRALPAKDRPKNARIQCELLVYQLHAPRFYPLVGPACLAQAHFKCTASADGKSDVVHIDRDHLIAER